MLTAASFFLAAFLYASVGHGGASAYLALSILFGRELTQAASAALILNLFVAGQGWIQFARAGYFSFRFLAPFLLGSIPFAFLGGYWILPLSITRFLLCVTLVFSALRLFWKQTSLEKKREIPFWVSVICGAVIGWVSGLVGVGGGIFLSPLLILSGMASVKEAAAASAAFIVLNSASGLAARAIRGLDLPPDILFLAVFSILGGGLGAYLGARRFSSPALRRLLALVLLIAAYKLGISLLSGVAGE